MEGVRILPYEYLWRWGFALFYFYCTHCLLPILAAAVPAGKDGFSLVYAVSDGMRGVFTSLLGSVEVGASSLSVYRVINRKSSPVGGYQTRQGSFCHVGEEKYLARLRMVRPDSFA